MKIFTLNPDNLKDSEINSIVTRVKVFLVNDKNEILIATSNGGCQLPGGHREENEDLNSTIKREIQEETGIILDDNELTVPFFEIKHYTKNYRGTGQKRISNIIYYYIRTNKNIDLNNTNYTEHEKQYNFSVEYVKISNFENFVNNFINESQQEINIAIAKELLLAFTELKNIL